MPTMQLMSGSRGQRVLDVALGAGLVDVVGANVDELDLGALDARP